MPAYPFLIFGFQGFFGGIFGARYIVRSLVPNSCIHLFFSTKMGQNVQAKWRCSSYQLHCTIILYPTFPVTLRARGVRKMLYHILVQVSHSRIPVPLPLFAVRTSQKPSSQPHPHHCRHNIQAESMVSYQPEGS